MKFGYKFAKIAKKINQCFNEGYISFPCHYKSRHDRIGTDIHWESCK